MSDAAQSSMVSRLRALPTASQVMQIQGSPTASDVTTAATSPTTSDPLLSDQPQITTNPQPETSAEFTPEEKISFFSDALDEVVGRSTQPLPEQPLPEPPVAELLATEPPAPELPLPEAVAPEPPSEAAQVWNAAVQQAQEPMPQQTIQQHLQQEHVQPPVQPPAQPLLQPQDQPQVQPPVQPTQQTTSFGKESAATQTREVATAEIGTTPAVEFEPSPEISPEVESFIQQVEQQEDQLPQEIVISGDAMQLQNTQYVAQPVVVLPYDKETEKAARFKGPQWSVRWLIEFGKKIIKIFGEKVIYRESPDKTS